MSTRPFQQLTHLLGLIHSGNWEQTSRFLSSFAEGPVPSSAEELDEYRRRLHAAMIAARAARANLKRDLTRVDAAQQFSSPYQAETSVPERCTSLTL